MAYETGTAASPGELLAKLFNFAGANGWVIDDDIADDTKSPARGSFHKNNIYVCFTFTTDLIHLYPARGFTASGTTEGAHPNSAFSSRGTSTLSGLLCAEIAGPLAAYHFFEDEVYLHVVIDIDGSAFRHFGFGESIKAGNWTGGEYFYGCTWLADGVANSGSPGSSRNYGPFNGYAQQTSSLEGGMFVFGTQNGGIELPGSSVAGSKWGYVHTYNAGALGSDIDGFKYNRLYNLSSTNGGLTSRLLGTGVSESNGFVPLVPMNYGLVDTSSAPDNIYFLGSYPDVRACNLRALTPGQEYVIDTDTWVVFPLVKKEYVSTAVQSSRNHGLAFKKVTT